MDPSEHMCGRETKYVGVVSIDSIGVLVSKYRCGFYSGIMRYIKIV